jgi:hypothetical protein
LPFHYPLPRLRDDPEEAANPFFPGDPGDETAPRAALTQAEILSAFANGAMVHADAARLLGDLGNDATKVNQLLASALQAYQGRSRFRAGLEGEGTPAQPLTVNGIPVSQPTPATGFRIDDPATLRDLIADQPPQAAFFGSQGVEDQFARSQGRKRFFQNQFENIHNQFLGSLGSQLRQGQLPQVPKATFSEFLGGFDFNKAFLEQPAAFRAPIGGENRLNPTFRTITNF